MHKHSLIILLIILTAVNCFGQVLMSPDERSTKGKIDRNNTDPIIVVVNDDASYGLSDQKLDKDRLFMQLNADLDLRDITTRTIYIRSDGKTSFAKIAEVLRMGRRLNVDNFAFLTGTDPNPEAAPKLKIVLEEPPKSEPKPWAGFLGVEIRDGDKLLLNKRPVTEAQLLTRLTNAFALRKKNRVYIVGSKDVDKTVFIKPLLSTKFESLMSVVNTAKKADAFPIAITIDWLKP